MTASILRHDDRPEFRVAIFGLAARFRRLLEIVLRHAHHNPYRYSIARSGAPGRFDLVLIDMTAQGAPRLFETLTRVVDRETVVRVGRRCDPSRQQDDLLVQSFVAQVLATLNRVVDRRLSPPARPGAAEVPPGPGRTALQALRRPRVLAVDDNPTVRRHLGAVLCQWGIDCDAVAGATEALERLAARRYELVLTDVVMPDIDGYRLTRMIRKDPRFGTVPVVILSARASPFDLARGALAGCSGYLVKPVMLQSLRETVLRHLRSGPRRTPTRGGPRAPLSLAP